MKEYKDMSTEEFAEELYNIIHNGASVSDVMYKLDEWKKDLQHFRDSSVGLWCTDRKDLIKDEQNIMFNLK